ncbi:MAG: periplasmic heavy metal sensor [Thermodesulfobacteriota bacterium]
MKRKFVILIGIFLALLAPSWASTFAQGVQKGQETHSGTWSGDCLSLERLDLSAEQREALNGIDAQFKAQVLQHRNTLMLERIELRGLLRDPGAGKDAIQAKARAMREAREVLQRAMIDYQIRIREILRPEQIRRWCTLMGAPLLQGGWKD